jgi:hypothetical protein
LQQVFDAWPWLFHSLVRTHQRSWQTLAEILRGERRFREVGQVLHRHPTLVRTALWLRGKGREALALSPTEQE